MEKCQNVTCNVTVREFRVSGENTPAPDLEVVSTEGKNETVVGIISSNLDPVYCSIINM